MENVEILNALKMVFRAFEISTFFRKSRCSRIGIPDFPKNADFQKIIRPGRLFKFRRDATKVYTEIPLLLESSLDDFEKVSESAPWRIMIMAVYRHVSACYGQTHCVEITFFPLELHLFCEFMEPPVPEFRCGSEFLSRN